MTRYSEIPQLPLDHPQFLATQPWAFISGYGFGKMRTQVSYGDMSPNEMQVSYSGETSTHLYLAAQFKDPLWLMELIRLGYEKIYREIVFFFSLTLFFLELQLISKINQGRLRSLQHAIFLQDTQSNILLCKLSCPFMQVIY